MVSWIYLWILVQSTELWTNAASPPRYALHHTKVSFDQAAQDCSPGVLTTLATEQEVSSVLGLISRVPLPQREFTFWVGLKKDNNKCVVPTLPLRGFRWVEDDSEDSQVSRWAKEPQDTCTSVRCVVLKGESDGSSVTRWGLVPVTCKETSVHPFICKLRDQLTSPVLKDNMSTVGPTALEPVTRPTVKPAELEPPEPKPETKPERDSGPHSGSGVEPNVCRHPVIPRARSLRLDPGNSSRVQVECWSTDQLDLYCWGRPAVWRLLDGSHANFSTLCQPCGGGLQKDASGNCVDVNECTSAPCRGLCLNTEGSYRCVCADEDGKHHDEGSPACTHTVAAKDGVSLSGILIPVLVAVAALLVLLVAAAMTVRCCLRRRARKCKESEKTGVKNEESNQI